MLCIHFSARTTRHFNLCTIVLLTAISILPPFARLQLAEIEDRERGLAVVALEHVALAGSVGKDIQVVVAEGVANEDVVGGDGWPLELQARKLDVRASLRARIIDENDGSGSLVLVLALNDVVGDLDSNGAVEDDSCGTTTLGV